MQPAHAGTLPGQDPETARPPGVAPDALRYVRAQAAADRPGSATGGVPRADLGAVVRCVQSHKIVGVGREPVIAVWDVVGIYAGQLCFGVARPLVCGLYGVTVAVSPLHVVCPGDLGIVGTRLDVGLAVGGGRRDGDAIPGGPEIYCPVDVEVPDAGRSRIVEHRGDPQTLLAKPSQREGCCAQSSQYHPHIQLSHLL